MLAVLGLIIAIVGGVLFYLRKQNIDKVDQIIGTETSTAKSLQELRASVGSSSNYGDAFKYFTEVKGVIECSQPLISEAKKVPCVYYKMTVEREMEEEYWETVTDSSGRSRRELRRRRRWDTITSNERGTVFEVRDDTGTTKVDPTGSEIDLEMVYDYHEPGNNYSGGGIGFSLGNFNISIPVSSGGSRILGYRTREWVMPIGKRVYVLGEASDASGELRIQKPTEKGKKFIISRKTEEELVKSAQSSAKGFFIGSIVCFAIGGILILIGLFSLMK